MGSEKQFRVQTGVWQNVHNQFVVIVPDAAAPSLEAQVLHNAIDRAFEGRMIDDSWVDAGDFNFDCTGIIFIHNTAVDPTQLDELEERFQPLLTDEPHQALDTLLMGDSAGGAGVSYGNTAAQTQIDIINNTHNITAGLPLGALPIYQVNGTINWVRNADLAPGAIPLATEVGDATHIVLATMPANGINENADESPGPRYFAGLPEYTNMTGNGWEIMINTVDCALHYLTSLGINRILAEIDGIRKARQRMAPDLATGIQLTGNAVAWTYGAAAAVIGAGTVARSFRVLQVHIEEFSDSTDTYQIQFRKITAGTVLASFKFSAPFAQTVVNLGIKTKNISPADGVEARVATKNGGSATIRISLGYERG